MKSNPLDIVQVRTWRRYFVELFMSIESFSFLWRVGLVRTTIWWWICTWSILLSYYYIISLHLFGTISCLLTAEKLTLLLSYCLLQSAWEHHGALIRCICIIGDAVHSIEYFKNIQCDGVDDRIGDIRACLEDHKVGGGLLFSDLNYEDFFCEFLECIHVILACYIPD